MKLFLTSSCISETLREPFLRFLGKPPEDIKLYFIPTASDVDDEKFFTVKSMDDLAVMGINPIWYSLRFKNRDRIAADLGDADVIWVNGGNTFYLLDVARRVGFMDIVGHFVRDKGVMYGGTSAGSILASPTIESAGWGVDADTNDVGLADLRAFDFVKIMTQVHYEPALHKEMLLSKVSDLPIYAIPNDAAVEVIDGKITTYGQVEILS